ncbi:unnamed protein product, partial [Mesorhabditis belari]|uniref:Major facilitator superfamily (MFS) profile domain-containing protein n=1 Tax=Mesorhabditis belari TaxID=2138241 RepID=A0AAF3EQY7_9BILA
MEESPLFSLKSFRLRFGFLLTFGLWAVWSMRLNLNMAIPCMVNSTLTSGKTKSFRNETNQIPLECQRASNEPGISIGYDGTLEWSPPEQAMLFSSTFYGAFVTIFFSGYLADRFGAKILLLAASMIFVVISYLSPLIANHSFFAFFISRLIMGLAEGFMFPCLNSLAARWFPTNEKSTMAAIYTSGIQIASGFSSLISSFLCLSIFGWPSIFYFFAITGTIWCICCLIFISNSPLENRFVPENERKFLEVYTKSTKTISKTDSMPWREILTSKEVFACTFCNLSCNFISNLLQSFLPLYLKEVLLLPMSQNGLYTMVPFCSQLLSKNTMGPFSDYLKRKGYNRTRLGKIFQTISGFGSAIAVILLSIVPSCERPYLAIPCLMAYGLTFSCLVPGYFTSVISIAGPYTGTITSLGSILGTIGNLAGPLLLALMNYLEIENKWTICLCASALVQMIGGVIFSMWGTADVLPWAKEVEKTPKAIDSMS